MIAGEEGALRLTDSGNGATITAGEGVLEIFHAGAWGSVCAAEQDIPAFRTPPPSPFTSVRLKSSCPFCVDGAVFMSRSHAILIAGARVASDHGRP